MLKSLFNQKNMYALAWFVLLSSVSSLIIDFDFDTEALNLLTGAGAIVLGVYGIRKKETEEMSNWKISRTRGMRVSGLVVLFVFLFGWMFDKDAFFGSLGMIAVIILSLLVILE